MKKDSLDETIAVYDRLGAKYADKIAHVRLPQLQEFINMFSGIARILDLGCAAGRDSAILRDAGFEVVGVDLSKNLLKLAKERVLGVKFLCMDARRLNFEHDTFDGIWAHAMLLNLDRSEVPSVLHDFWRIMKPKGICLIGVKEGKGEKFIGEDLVDNMKRRETYFGQSEMKGLLSEIGFEISKSYIYGDELGRSTTKWIYVFSRK